MLTAQDAMTTEIVSVSPDTAIGEVAALLLRNDVSGLPVEDATGRLVGMITEMELLACLCDQTALTDPVSARMTRNVVAVEENEPLDSVAERLSRLRIRRVPVVRDGRVVGIVSRRDLIRLATRRSRADAAATGPEFRIVVVDDDPEFVQSLVGMLHRCLDGQAHVVEFRDAVSAMEWFRRHAAELLIVDLDLPGPCGLKLLRFVKRRYPWTQVLAATGRRQKRLVSEAMEGGAADYLLKPLDRREFTQQITRAVKTQRRWSAALATAFKNDVERDAHRSAAGMHPALA